MEIPPEKEWKFKRQRLNPVHIENCKAGYPTGYPAGPPYGKSPRWMEVHHILCVKACSDSSFPGDATSDNVVFFKLCMAITKWDINAEPNTIGLPTKVAYVEDKTYTWDLVPCHQVDHDLYLDKVEDYVRTKIWKELKNSQDEEDCEEITGKNIVQLFNDAITIWKDFLTGRGVVNGGARAAFDYCYHGGQSTPGLINDDNWHIPFSMSPVVAEIRKRVKPKPMEPIVREALLDIL